MTPTERRDIEANGCHVFDEPRIYASINKLADFTGHDRRTVTERLQRAGLEWRPGPKGARLYATDTALWAIVTGGRAR